MPLPVTDQCTKEEIKQMLGVYGNRIFADHYPDSELNGDTGADKGSSCSKKKTYEEYGTGIMISRI
ncbi:MAG: hypothetical protein ACLRTA_05685 [Clostridia bacterium]